MSLVQRQGVHQLIATEKKALEQINEAKRRRNIRLKQAREEAAVEIGALRGELEAKFSRFEKDFLGKKDEIQKGIEEEIALELQSMERSVQEHKDTVVQRILDLVCDIRPELHHNLLIQQKIQKDAS